MRVLTALCCLVAVIDSGNTVIWDTIKVKYTVGFDGHYPIPLKLTDIKDEEFVFLADHEAFPLVKVYCLPDDPRVCPMYDSHGNIAGLRVSYLVDELQGTRTYSFDKPIFKRGKAYMQDLYYIDALFISPDMLLTGGPETRDEPVGDGVYLNIVGTQWMKMPRTQTAAKETAFTKQACFLGMGMHYFYAMTPNMPCQSHQPPFLLYDGEDMIGFGLIPFGLFSGTSKRTWFEKPPKSVISMIVPNGPECLPIWVWRYGAISLHVFFKSNTRLLCLL